MSDTVFFIVMGCAVPKERPRFSKRGHAYTSKRTRDFEKKVADIAKSKNIRKLDGDLWINMVFFVPDKRRRDGGNLAKGVEDALNEIAYDDDSQIKRCTWEVCFDKEEPRTEITIGRR